MDHRSLHPSSVGIVGSQVKLETSFAVNVASRWSKLINSQKFKRLESPGENLHCGFEQNELNNTGLLPKSYFKNKGADRKFIN